MDNEALDKQIRTVDIVERMEKLNLRAISCKKEFKRRCIHKLIRRKEENGKYQFNDATLAGERLPFFLLPSYFGVQKNCVIFCFLATYKYFLLWIFTNTNARGTQNTKTNSRLLV